VSGQPRHPGGRHIPAPIQDASRADQVTPRPALPSAAAARRSAVDRSTIRSLEERMTSRIQNAVQPEVTTGVQHLFKAVYAGACRSRHWS
jgi:hypothetical protein